MLTKIIAENSDEVKFEALKQIVSEANEIKWT